MKRFWKKIEELCRETEKEEENATGKIKWKIAGQNSAYNHVAELIKQQLSHKE